MKLEEIFENTKQYETIQEKRIIGFDQISEALTIVQKFIIKKKRILYGGMCIDMNLKKAGHKGIYGPETVPDYDFYSPDPYTDAKELCDILYTAKFEGVKNHNAMHVSTRRVLIFNTVVVADISYMPEPIYKTIPVQIYNGLNIVHPNFQRMDMHRAMSRPFDSDPWTVILHRTAKDLKRFKLLDEAYPIKASKKQPITNKTISLPKTKQSIMLDGFAAYAYIRKAALSLIRSEKFKAPLNSVELDVMPGDINNKNGKLVFTDIPHISIIAEEYINLAKELGVVKAKYYNQYGDETRPLTIKSEDYEIFNGFGVKYPAYKFECSEHLHSFNSDFPLIPENCYVASIQRVLVYFIQRYNDYNNSKSDKAVALQYYESTLKLWDFGYKLYNLAPEAFETKLSEDADVLPFFISATLFGTQSIGADYIAYIYEKKYMMDNTTGGNLRMPGPYYPERPGSFTENYKYDSIILDFDGAEVPEPKKHL